MATTPSDPIPDDAPPRGVDGERDYGLLALVSLVVLGLVLFLEDLGFWALIPVLVGCMSILRKRGSGPALTLFPLLLIVAFRNLLLGIPWWYRIPGSPLADVVFGLALVVYVVAHARLLSLRSLAVPGDARRSFTPRDERLQGRWLLPAAETKRSAGKVTPAEFVWLLSGTA